MRKLGDYQAARRDKLIKLINKWQITPAPLVAGKAGSRPGPDRRTVGFGARQSIHACDAADKLTNYVLTKKAKADGAASLEEWFDTHKGSKVKSLSLSWSLKGLALVLNGWNLYAAITTARYDYQANQSTVSKLSWAQNAAGATAAVQDVLAEIANLLKNQHLKAIFPQLMTTGGSTYHYEVTTIETGRRSNLRDHQCSGDADCRCHNLYFDVSELNRGLQPRRLLCRGLYSVGFSGRRAHDHGLFFRSL